MPADFPIGPRRSSVPKPKKRRAPAPRIGAPLGRADQPLLDARDRATRAVSRAQTRLPKRPTPAIPRTKYPTKAMRETARELVLRAQTTATGDRPSRVATYQRELREDPRQAEYLKTTTKLARSELRSLRAHQGKDAARQAVKSARAARGRTATRGFSGTIPSEFTNDWGPGFQIGGDPGAGGVTRGQSGTIPAFETAATRPSARVNQLAAGSAVAREALAAGANPRAKGRYIPPPPEMKLLGVDLYKGAEVLGDIASPLATGLAAVGVKEPQRVVQNIFKDALDLPANTAGAVYYTGQQAGRTAGAAIEGDPARFSEELRKLGKIAVDPYVQAIENPSTLADHPLNNALLAFGTVTGAGALAGRVARSGALGDAAAAGASRHLVTAELPGTRFATMRFAPKDLIQTKLRRRRDERNAAKADDLRTQVFDAEQDVLQGVPGADDRVMSLRREIARTDPAVVSERDIRKGVADIVQTGDSVRRLTDQEAQNALTKAEKGLGADASTVRALRTRKAVPPGAGRFVVTQGITKPERASLQRYHDQIADAAEGLKQQAQEAPTAELRAVAEKRLKANLDLQVQLRKTIDSDPDAILALRDYAEAYRAIARPMERELIDAGLYTVDQAERSALTPYATVNMDATFVPKHYVDGVTGEELTAAEVRAIRDEHGDAAMRGTGDTAPLIRQVDDHWETPDGEILSRQTIRDDMEAHGFADPTYLPMGVRESLKSMYYRNTLEAPGLDNYHTRTGESAKTAYDAHPVLLRAQLSRLANFVGAIRGWRQVTDTFGLRRSDGELFRGKHEQASQEALMMTRRTGIDHGVFKLNPLHGKQDQLQALVQSTKTEDFTGLKPLHDALKSGLEGAADDANYTGDWGVAPRSALSEMSRHLDVSGGGSIQRTAQLIVGMFRKTVLATNPRWLYGNVFEAAMRAVINQAGPRSHALFMQMKDDIERQHGPEAALQFDAAVTGVGQYGAALRVPKRYAEQFYLDPATGNFTKRAARVAEALRNDQLRGPNGRPIPSPKNVADGYKLLTDAVLTTNAHAERWFRRAQAGRGIKELFLDPRASEASRQAVLDGAEGLTGTPAQMALARYVRDAYGKYDGYGPTMRSAINNFTPFIPWALSSVNFLTRVLPRDHPLLVAAMVSASQASEEWRRDHGLVKFMEGAVPDFLQGSIPTSSGGKVRVSRYTPFSVAADPLSTFADSVLPWLQPALYAANGLDWKGDPLRGANGNALDDLGKAQMTMLTFLQGVIPLWAQGARVAGDEGGVVRGLRREIEPFPVTKPRGSGSASGPLDDLQQKYGIETKGTSIDDLKKKYGIGSQDKSIDDLKKKYGLGG